MFKPYIPRHCYRAVSAFALCLLATAWMPFAAAQERGVFDAACSFDPADFGIVPVVSAPLLGDSTDAEQIYLRAKVLRYESSAQESQLAMDGAPRELVYRDVVLLYHLPEARMLAEIGNVESTLAIEGNSRLIEIEFCDFHVDGQMIVYSPFASVAEGEKDIAIQASVVVLTRAVSMTMLPQPLVRVPPSDDAITSLLSGLGLPEPPELAATSASNEGVSAESEGAPEAKTVTWQRNFYPWIVDLDLASLSPGDEVFAVDKVRCEPGGNFIVGSTGSIALPQEREPASDEELPVRRQQMIAANLYFGASGDPLNQTAVAASVDDTAYWCIPKRELCFQKIDFGDFSIRSRQGEITQFTKNSVVSMRYGLAAALQRVVMDNCPQETLQGK